MALKELNSREQRGVAYPTRSVSGMRGREESLRPCIVARRNVLGLTWPNVLPIYYKLLTLPPPPVLYAQLRSLLCASHTSQVRLMRRCVCLLCANNRCKISFEAELEAVMTRQIIPEIFFSLCKTAVARRPTHVALRHGKYLLPRKHEHVKSICDLTGTMPPVRSIWKTKCREMSSISEYLYKLINCIT